jgi:hypothetical protein
MVVGGVTAHSQNYRVIMHTVAAPSGGLGASTQFKLRGGVVGSTQGK